MAQSLKEMNSALINGLGLDDGFRLPVANDENKKLEEKVNCFIMFDMHLYNSMVIIN